MQFRSLLGKNAIFSALEAEFSNPTTDDTRPNAAIRTDTEADLSKVIHLAREVQKVIKGSVQLEVLQR